MAKHDNVKIVIPLIFFRITPKSKLSDGKYSNGILQNGIINF